MASLRGRTCEVSEPVPATAENIVVRCNAVHNDLRAEKRASDQYRQFRAAVHFCVGCKVMLTQNHIWNVPVVQMGLMNGARGQVVAIVYAAPGYRLAPLAFHKHLNAKLVGVGMAFDSRSKFSCSIHLFNIGANRSSARGW